MKYQNNAIGDENSRKLFDVKLQFSKHEIMDQIKFEYKSYQIENIPDNYYELPVDKDQNVKRRRPSYWREMPTTALILISHHPKTSIVGLMNIG